MSFFSIIFAYSIYICSGPPPIFGLAPPLTFGDLKQVIEDKTGLVRRQPSSSRNNYGRCYYDGYKDDNQILNDDIKKYGAALILNDDIKKYGAALVMGEEVEFDVKTAFFNSMKFKCYEAENVSDIGKKVSAKFKWVWESTEECVVVDRCGGKLDTIMKVAIGGKEEDDFTHEKHASILTPPLTFGDLKRVIEDKTGLAVRRQPSSSRNSYGRCYYDGYKDDNHILNDDIKKYGAALVMGAEMEFDGNTAFFNSMKFKCYEAENVSDLGKKVNASVWLVFYDHCKKEIVYDDELSLGEVVDRCGGKLDTIMKVAIGGKEEDDVTHDVYVFSNLIKIYV
ncbi:hypothetical protein TSUD_47000 [Trifolium subterraneum]|nr:hypothetical protein TSUD_47000 [Trifolium subterraneum]